MKNIINLALKTEYTFKNCFGFTENLTDYAESGYVGVADVNNSFAHPILEQACKKKNIKPIYGARLRVVADVTYRVEGSRGALAGHNYIFIAKNNDGLKEIYRLIKSAWDNFYYVPMISAIDVFKLSDNVFVIAESYEFAERIDLLAIGVTTPKTILNDTSIPHVAINNNWYSEATDKNTYQLLAGSVKRGDEYHYNFERQTYPQHILSTKEWFRLFKDEKAINNTHIVAEQCDVTLSKAPMVKFKEKVDIAKLCRFGAKKRKVDLKDPIYSDRLERELKLIEEKDYTDYFLIVNDMIQQAKKKQLVGPSRGSSAGSLVCYLLGITEVDPIEYNLLFERFIDLNREDLPDIDVDFPDKLRKKVIQQLIKDYGGDKVTHISNVNRLKPRSAIGEFAKALSVPMYETEVLKDAIVERSPGHERAKLQILDTFESTEIGRDFIKKYPEMQIVEGIEQHASHAGMHAAGIIVCNNPLTEYAGINTRDNSMMCDKRTAEYLNLLKIDCLGLRTLTVLMDTAKLAGFDFHDYYNLDVKNEEVYTLFAEMRLSGIFQFEGQALQSICNNMGCSEFNDIVVITSLARPGPMIAGAHTLFCDRKTGRSEVEYLADHPTIIDITEETLGCIIYQEQIMRLCKELGNMSWEDVSTLRKAMGKSLGNEYFDTFKEKFVAGCNENGLSETDGESVWNKMLHFGKYGFNKSHAVSYALVSFWTAWAKHYYPLEFAVANLNNAKDDESALNLLRDLVQNDNIEYLPICPERSIKDWSVQDGIIIGGLTNIAGIGPQKANKIIKDREAGAPFTPAIREKLANPVTYFDELYPCQKLFGPMYEDPEEYGAGDKIDYIKDIYEIGEYTFIGRVESFLEKDQNDYNEVQKRGGKMVDGNSKFLKLTLIDDTDKIQCRINRFNFEKLCAADLAEDIVEDETYVIVKGKIKGDYRLVDIDTIFNLTGFEI